MGYRIVGLFFSILFFCLSFITIAKPEWIFTGQYWVDNDCKIYQVIGALISLFTSTYVLDKMFFAPKKKN